MTRWVRCFWDQAPMWFYVEPDADGTVVWQVEPVDSLLQRRLRHGGLPLGQS